MNNDWAFLPMRTSNGLLGDPTALRQRLDEDSYLYFRRLLDPDKVTSLRQRMLTVLADAGWVRRKPFFMRGFVEVPPAREGDEDFFVVYDEVQKLEEFHTLAHDDTLIDVMRQVLGDSAFPHPLKIARLGFPDHAETSTPPHQDYPNNQGTENLTAAWIPVGECPIDLGGLAILRGSHHHGLLQLDTHIGAGNRKAVVPVELLEKCRWVTTEYSAGDVLGFKALTVHAALHNASEFLMRLSVDFRYQLEGEALTPICLEPHFQRLAWEDVYAGWGSDRYQYYWRDLDYEVVPFRELELVADDDRDLRDLKAFLAYERRRDNRVRRRLERLTELLDPDGRDAAPSE
jgi:hypothetical protein